MFPEETAPIPCLQIPIAGADELDFPPLPLLSLSPGRRINARRNSLLLEVHEFNVEETIYEQTEEHADKRKEEEKVHIDGEGVAVNVAVETAPTPRKVGVDDFQMLSVIGKGAYGKVFLVRKRDKNRVYAMKVLKKATLLLHSTASMQPITERDLLSKISHPFIVKLYYAFQTTDRLYLILSYAQGGELFSFIRKERMLSEDVAKFYCSEVVLALEHLHSLGIIYRDLKPENILLDSDGHVVLTDFGLSKVSLDGTRTVCGTAEYMAPEIIQEQTYDQFVDYWSLGILLFDMLTGAPPFVGPNRKIIMDNIIRKKTNLPAYLTPNAKDLITKLLKKNPSQRLGIQGIKSHRFFKSTDWVALFDKDPDLIEVPFKPNVNDDFDTQYFDDTFTKLPVSLDDGYETGGASPGTPPILSPKKKKNKKNKKVDESSSPSRVSQLAAAARQNAGGAPPISYAKVASVAPPANPGIVVTDASATEDQCSTAIGIPTTVRETNGNRMGSLAGSGQQGYEMFSGFSFVAEHVWLEDQDV
ncbi:kinase-like domain-containing protein [Cladochytrium replicatum]|nr:kinase-like domain-containing protein [Cladochytrium replicatum]